MPTTNHDYELTIPTPAGSNFTAASLLKKHVDATPYTQLRYTPYGIPLLYEKGKVYRYAGWNIEEKAKTYFVTIYLKEVAPKKGAR